MREWCSPSFPDTSSNLMPFKMCLHAGGTWHYREKPCRAIKHARANRGVLYRLNKHKILRGQREAQSSTSQGGAELLCVRIKRASNREVMPSHVLFSYCKYQKGAANSQLIRGVFQGYLGLWTGACLLTGRLHQLKAPITLNADSIFLFSVCPGFAKHGLFDHKY